jgi:hypothetical protein
MTLSIVAMDGNFTLAHELTDDDFSEAEAEDELHIRYHWSLKLIVFDGLFLVMSNPVRDFLGVSYLDYLSRHRCAADFKYVIICPQITKFDVSVGNTTGLATKQCLNKNIKAGNRYLVAFNNTTQEYGRGRVK